LVRPRDQEQEGIALNRLEKEDQEKELKEIKNRKDLLWNGLRKKIRERRSKRSREGRICSGTA